MSVALALAACNLPARPELPRFAEVRAAYCPSDARVLDRQGAVVHEQRVDLTRRRLAWTPLNEVSPALVAALLASEDRRFVAHGGVDWRAAGAALSQRLRGDPPRGASTVSMQVAALLDPALRPGASGRTLEQKWRQMRAAWTLERTWSKEQILTAYLNLISFRGELQGVSAAAHVLFGKAPHGLTRAESLVLAALVRAPNAGRGEVLRRASALGRADVSMPANAAGAAAGALDEAALVAAVDRAVAVPSGSGPRIALAAHAARRLLPPTAPLPCADTPSALDADLQRHAAESVRRHLLAIRDRSAADAAVLVADNATGEVLAYVGASGELSSARHVDGIQARRQAGSTLKPFLYALAIDKRLLTAASILEDTPLEVSAGNGLFRPRDYDDIFRGPVSLRSALAGSLNVPAVRTLLLVGAGEFAASLRRFGLTAVARAGDYYGPALALGAADVNLWQLVGAYRALANGGLWTPLRLDPRALSDGAPVRAVGAAAAFVVADVLADRESRSMTFGLENPLATRFWSAVKTGTSTDMRDNWCIGFSHRYTVGVWVGNFSGEPMRDVSGVTGAAPIWEEVMDWLHRDSPSEVPGPPEGVVSTAVVPLSGEPQRREWFLAGTEPARAQLVRSRLPRILAPADGTVLALDPDVAPGRRRLAFAAESAGDGARWVLDGTDLGSAAAPYLWEPAAGRHVLQLTDGAGRTLGSVRFEVRG